MVHDRLQREDVVGVDPEGELLFPGPTLELDRGDATELACDQIERGAVRLERCIVDPGTDDVSAQQLGVGAVSLVERIRRDELGTEQ